uniref:Uncharacterized protein n=1 Tax=Rhabditophanes sp. KR3021 TaxID=114890 RepID=A0AC35UHG8_9BILA
MAWISKYCGILSLFYFIIQSCSIVNGESGYVNRRNQQDQDYRTHQAAYNSDRPRSRTLPSREVYYRSREKCLLKCALPCSEVTASLSFGEDETDYPQDILFKCLRLKPIEKSNIGQWISTSPPLIAAALLLIVIVLMLVICIICSLIGSCKRRRRLERNRIVFDTEDPAATMPALSENTYVKVSANHNGLIQIDDTARSRTTNSDC